MAIILVMICTSCANYSTWTKTDKVLGGMSLAAGMADAYTTERCLDHPGFEEGNPLMGKHPSDGRIYAQITASHLIILWIADRYPKIRKLLLGGTTVVGAGAAYHNRELYRR